MKKIICFLFIFGSIVCKAQTGLNIVPMPAEVKMRKGYVAIDNKTTISVTGPLSTSLESLAAYLQNQIKIKTGMNLQIAKDRNYQNKKSDILLSLELYKTMPGDLYELNISKKHAAITGNKTENIFHGIQTLLQIIEQSSTEKRTTNNGQLLIPQLTILDAPRFKYRGMHLDVGRHFFPISFIKKYIDYLAAYKFNTFHWHLTEDQGWRIEIKKYPELTTTGGWRNGTIIGRYPGKGSDNLRYGGFYTQAEIKEVVQYAKDRYIDTRN